jgi:hypothetical protein
MRAGLETDLGQTDPHRHAAAATTDGMSAVELDKGGSSQK